MRTFQQFRSTIHLLIGRWSIYTRNQFGRIDMSKALNKAEEKAARTAQAALGAFQFAVNSLEQAAAAQEALVDEAKTLANLYGDQAAYNASEAERNRARVTRLREIFDL
jgi:hypothetical protein